MIIKVSPTISICALVARVRLRSLMNGALTGWHSEWCYMQGKSGMKQQKQHAFSWAYEQLHQRSNEFCGCTANGQYYLCQGPWQKIINLSTNSEMSWTLLLILKPMSSCFDTAMSAVCIHPELVTSVGVEVVLYHEGDRASVPHPCGLRAS
jgi:hypothetical protein